MIKKYLICLTLIYTACSLHGISLSPALITRMTSNHLMSVMKYRNDPELSEQLGKILFDRNFFPSPFAGDHVLGTPDERPAYDPSHPIANGQWVWYYQTDPADYVWVWHLWNTNLFITLMLQGVYT
jgi:hypothetical protein